MGFMEIPKSLGVPHQPGRSLSLEGAATLVLPDGRSAPVTASMSMSRGFLWLSGGGSFTCGEQTAFEALNSTGWPRLVFDGTADVEIFIFEVRTSKQQTRCRFEVHS